MLRPDVLTTPSRERLSGHRSLFLAGSFSLFLHAAALACFYWSWDATPAPPVRIFAVELVVSPGAASGSGDGAEDLPASSEQGRRPVLEATPALVAELPAESIETSEKIAPVSAAEVRARPGAVVDRAAPSSVPLVQTSIEPEPAGEAASEPVNAVSVAKVSLVRRAPPSSSVPLPPTPRPKPAVPNQMARPESSEPSALGDDERPVENVHAPTRQLSPAPTKATYDAPEANEREAQGHGRTSVEEAAVALPLAGFGRNRDEAKSGGPAGPRFSARGLANPAPRYPYLARLRGQEGRVILRVRVSPAGRAESVSIIRSSGHRLLDVAAAEVVEKWRFIPAYRGGGSLASSVDVPITFKLED